MATFIMLHDATDNSEVMVNADQILTIRRADGYSYSTLNFADSSHQFGVKEPQRRSPERPLRRSGSLEESLAVIVEGASPRRS